MANEVEIISNPTSTPAAVSTGYQRQNTRMVAASVGMDNTIVEGGAAQVTCLISGPVDVNGVLYTIKTEAILALTTAGRWYIYLETGGDVAYLTPTLTDDPGAYDETKFARYTSANKRILNWLIDFDGTTARVTRWVTPEYSGNQNSFPDLDTQPETWITADGTWTAPRSKYYTIWVTGNGENGGVGGRGGITGASAELGSAGGRAGSSGVIRKFINAGDVWTATFGTYTTTFSDGVTTLSAGSAGGAVSGFDQSFVSGGYRYGGVGGAYADDVAQPGQPGQPGADSIYGGGGAGGRGGFGGAMGGAAGNATAPGAGGGCGGGGSGKSSVPASGSGSGGLGAAGIIRIIG